MHFVGIQKDDDGTHKDFKDWQQGGQLTIRNIAVKCM